MVEILTYAALMFTGKPAVSVHCPIEWTASANAYVLVFRPPYRAEVWMPRFACRDLRKRAPHPQSIDDFTHELIHLRFPRVKHGVEMRSGIRRYRGQVCRLLKVSCRRTYPKPDPRT